MSTHNAGFDLDELVESLPAGVDRALLRILGYHTGREKAISRKDLVRALADHGFRIHERAMRAAVNLLRKVGHPICSTGGEDGGYWMAANWDELHEYIERELHSRAVDLLEQEKALRNEGLKRWGPPSLQFSMFDTIL